MYKIMNYEQLYITIYVVFLVVFMCFISYNMVAIPKKYFICLVAIPKKCSAIPISKQGVRSGDVSITSLSIHQSIVFHPIQK